MPLVIEPEGILRNHRHIHAILHTVGSAPGYTGHKNRYLRGTIRFIDDDALTFTTWEWETTATPALKTYHFGPIVLLQGPGSSTIFSNERIESLNEDPHPPYSTEQAIVLYILDALISISAREPARIADAMLLPEPLKPSVRPGIYQHYKGKEYLVGDVVLMAGCEHLPLYAQEWLVIYRPLYGNYGLRARPYAEFTEIVNTDEYDGPRFAFVRDA